MVRRIGTTSRGIITPIIREGDDLENIILDSLLKAAKSGNFDIRDRDILGITESLVARAQGNYVTLDDVKEDISRKFHGDIGLIFPILSRNRFASILKAMAMTGKTIRVFLNYPADELGNCLMDQNLMMESGINPYSDFLTESKYRKIFGEEVAHPYTGIDYVDLYKSLAPEGNIEVYLTNNPKDALDYAKEFLVANIHNRYDTKKTLMESGAGRVLCLDDIMTTPIYSKGYNKEFGLLGSNMATKKTIKLFPRDCQNLVNRLQELIKKETGRDVEVMVYGDGAFKDPQGKIWELADPVVSPGYTRGLEGTPNEIKLKYIADSQDDDIGSDDILKVVKQKIKNKNSNAMDKSESLGTTPRQLTDLLGSLCDLTSGSGDKGTPIVLVQGYFDNFASR